MSNKIDQVKVKAGRLIRVVNTLPHKAANSHYVSVWVEDSDGGNERCLFFTEREIKMAEHRANRNVEDLTKKSLLTDLLD